MKIIISMYEEPFVCFGCVHRRVEFGGDVYCDIKIMMPIFRNKCRSKQQGKGAIGIAYPFQSGKVIEDFKQAYSPEPVDMDIPKYEKFKDKENK